MASDFLFPQSEVEPSEPETETEQTLDLASVVPPVSAEARLVERFGQLIEQKAALTRELEEIKKEMDTLQPRMLTFFTAINPNLRGTKLRLETLTLFVRRDLYVRAKYEGEQARQEVCDALRSSGMGQYVHDAYNAHRLNSWARELETQHEHELTQGLVNDLSDLIPPALARVLNLNPTWSVQGRRRFERKKHA